MQNAHGPLLFYKENMETFPLLSQIAKAIFCMLPASLASERLFRGSGRIVTKSSVIKNIIGIKFSCLRLVFFFNFIYK